MVGDVNHAAARPITVIEGDAWDRALAVLGDTVDPAARRANLMVRGVSLEDSRGKVLRIGACRIRFRGETRPCHVMDEAREGLRTALADEWRGGAYGDVIEGGPVAVGDPVAWEPEEAGA
jgi:MOSC domain-containing protein YiiM